MNPTPCSLCEGHGAFMDVSPMKPCSACHGSGVQSTSTTNKKAPTTMNKITTIAIAATLALGVTACATDADVASQNLSKAADQFEIERRVVFMNGITNEYMLTIEGLCSIEDQGNQLEVVCKDNDGRFVKHFLGLSDNVTYFVEQTQAADASTSRYRVTFKPTTLIPSIQN
jgi:DnaJ-class molecular chaperone